MISVEEVSPRSPTSDLEGHQRQKKRESRQKDTVCILFMLYSHFLQLLFWNNNKRGKGQPFTHNTIYEGIYIYYGIWNTNKREIKSTYYCIYGCFSSMPFFLNTTTCISIFHIQRFKNLLGCSKAPFAFYPIQHYIIQASANDMGKMRRSKIQELEF